jgi:UPF0716 protein FxsA
MSRLLILPLVVTVIEIYLLILVGGFLGGFQTTLLLMVISLFGLWLVKHQGFGLLRRVQSELSQGRSPAVGILDGVLVLAGGLLLVIPGFFTDILGLFLLVPFSRHVIRQFIGLWLQRRISNGVIPIRTVRL